MKERIPYQQISFEMSGGVLVEPNSPKKTVENIYGDKMSYINKNFVACANNDLLGDIRKKIGFNGTDDELNKNLFVLNPNTPNYLIDRDKKTYSTSRIVVYQIENMDTYDNPHFGTARYMFVSHFDFDQLSRSTTYFFKNYGKHPYQVKFGGKYSEFYVDPKYTIPIEFSKDTPRNEIRAK